MYAVQFPGRESRYNERPFNRIAPLVEATCDALIGYLDKPFAFFGHSLGALVSFEVARTLAATYEIYPQQLFVSAFRAPHLSLPYAPVHNLTKAELVDILMSLHGAPQESMGDPQLIDLLLPAIRADLAICETYKYEQGPILTTPVMAYGGISDSRVSQPELDAWKEQTSGEFSLKLFEGGHFFLKNNEKDLLLDIAEILTHRIAQL